LVRAAQDEAFESFRVELQLHARGKLQGLVALAEQELSRDGFRAAEVHEYPFRLEAPRCPAVYRGQLFTVAPRLAAVLVPIAQREDMVSSLAQRIGGVSTEALSARAYPEAVRSIGIAPDTRPLGVSLDPERVDRSRKGRGLAIVVALVMLAVSLVLLGLMGILSWGEWQNWGVILGLGIPGALFAVIGLLLLRVNLGAWMAERRVGLPVLAAQTRQGPHGSVLEIRVGLPPRATIRGVRATVRVREEAVVKDAGGDDHSGVTIEQHPLVERPVTLLASGEPGLFSGEIPMTELAGLPQSMPVPSGQVLWRLRVVVQIPWWPDWEDTFTLGAYPGGESRSWGNPLRLTFE
jgi:hypothetical protein